MTSKDNDHDGMTTVGKLAGTIALLGFTVALIAGFLTDALDLWDSGTWRGLRVALLILLASAATVWIIEFVRAVIRVKRLDDLDS